MTDYTVHWAIQIEADDPNEAAEQALLIQRDRSSTATVFHVEAPDGILTTIDLTQENS